MTYVAPGVKVIQETATTEKNINELQDQGLLTYSIFFPKALLPFCYLPISFPCQWSEIENMLY